MESINKIVLIGGTSHCGKTTMAENLSRMMKVELISTDGLAKHPGRPWNNQPVRIPEHVRNHYSKLSTKEMMTSVLAHYESMWPRVQSKIGQAIENGSGLVMEGSALLPQFIEDTMPNNVITVWLTTGHENLRTRIYNSSRYRERPFQEKKLIDKFVDRTIAFDGFLAGQLGGEANLDEYTDKKFKEVWKEVNRPDSNQV